MKYKHNISFILMTSASFYKNEKPGSAKMEGVYFQLPEDELARELQRRKREEHSRALVADKIIS
jgi:hypothetical protein